MTKEGDNSAARKRNTDSPDAPERSEKPLWKNRGFIHLFWAHAVSLFGASLTSVALGLLAHELVGAGVSTVLGVTLAIRIGVVVFLAPFAGSVASWLGSKKALIFADLIRAGVVVGFFFCEAVWQIYVLAFLINVASAVFTPVYKAAIPNIVTPKQYPRALSIGSVAYDLANIAGPSLAGLLILWFGFRGNFLVHAAAFLMSAMLIFPVRFSREADSPKPATTGRLPGIRALLHRRELFRTLFIALQVSIGSGFVLVATVDYVKNTLLLPDSYYAWAMAAYGVGSVGGALAYGQSTNPKLRRLLYATLPWGILAGLLLAALTHELTWLLLGWLLAGSGQSVLVLRGNELLAANSTADERPHIYAAHFSLSHVGWGVTYPLAGWTTTNLGFHNAALIFALLLALAAAAQGVYFRKKGPAQ